MSFLSDRLRAFCYLSLLIGLFCDTAAAGSGMLELWFEYDGRPATLNAEPAIACLQQRDAKPFQCRSFRSDDGRYWIERPPAGNYRLQIGIDQNRANPPRHPGDLYRDYPFRVDSATTGPLLIALHELIELQEPDAGGAAKPDVASPCERSPEYSAAIVALFPTAEIDFSWRPLGADTRYRYTLWRLRCSDDLRLEQVLYRQTDSTRISERLPPNKAGEYYRFSLHAVHDNQTVGQLLLHGGNDGEVGAYPFRVSDPLIDRSWLYYLLALLLPLLLLWLVVGACRDRSVLKGVPAPDDIRRRRPRRPLVLLLLVAVAAGYWQREEVLPRLERLWPEVLSAAQQAREWVGGVDKGRSRGPTHGSTYAGSLTAGEWRGAIISASERPFSGQGRRVELQMHVTTEGVWVALRRDGRWQKVTESPFTLQPAGDGVTLFGHRRGADYSELWTLSIPALDGERLALSLDRIISRRSESGAVLSVERRRAGGEVHHVTP